MPAATPRLTPSAMPTPRPTPAPTPKPTPAPTPSRRLPRSAPARVTRSYSEHSGAIAYRGSWADAPYGGYIGGSVAWSKTPGSTATFTFTGSVGELDRPQGTHPGPGARPSRRAGRRARRPVALILRRAGGALPALVRQPPAGTRSRSRCSRCRATRTSRSTGSSSGPDGPSHLIGPRSVIPRGAVVRSRHDPSNLRRPGLRHGRRAVRLGAVLGGGRGRDAPTALRARRGPGGLLALHRGRRRPVHQRRRRGARRDRRPGDRQGPRLRDLRRAHQGHDAAISGVREFLCGARDAGLLLAVATGSGRPKLDANLAAIGVPERTFDVVVSAEQIERKKPDPETFLRAIEGLGVPAGRCLVVEDARNGVLAGRAAGCAVFGITSSLPASVLLTPARSPSPRTSRRSRVRSGPPSGSTERGPSWARPIAPSRAQLNAARTGLAALASGVSTARGYSPIASIVSRRRAAERRRPDASSAESPSRSVRSTPRLPTTAGSDRYRSSMP